MCARYKTLNEGVYAFSNIDKPAETQTKLKSVKLGRKAIF